MAVRIRFKKMGRKNRPSFRLVACDGHSPRDGRSLEQLGHYDPLVADEQKRFTVNEERVRFWIARGARPSESAEQFLRGRGILVPSTGRERKRRSERKRGRARRSPPAKGKAAAAPAAKK